MKRPNILFLISDEHRADIAGFAGNEVVRTPNLDRLAGDAVVFDNAYCPSPICVPGRQSMMAGIYPRRLGCETFDSFLPPGTMTLPRLLSQYAYQTVAAGKTHDDGYDQLMGFNWRIGFDMKLRRNFLKDPIEEEFARYSRPIGEVKWTQDKEIRRAGPGRNPREWADQYALEGAKMALTEHFLDPWYDREQPQQPLMLYYGTIAPHYPYICEESLFEYYLNRVPVYEGQEAFAHPFLSRMRVRVGADISRREAQRATAAYYGMIEAMDRRFGDLIEAVRHVGEDIDDWIVVYTSDHGEMLGEHEVWEKQKFFEGSARVPLMIRFPKRFAPRRVKENVNTLDLFTTLCDLCGIPAPEELDSRSLLPLMEGDASNWDNETASQFGGKNLMIKQGDLKYHYYEDDGSELLFDLKRDPGETTDFSRDAMYAQAMELFRKRRGGYQYA